MHRRAGAGGNRIFDLEPLAVRALQAAQERQALAAAIVIM
jgi:hypothetical protein